MNIDDDCKLLLTILPHKQLHLNIQEMCVVSSLYPIAGFVGPSKGSEQRIFSLIKDGIFFPFFV
jgi:hypothetical protein